jgi:hypothetical protein
MLPGVAGTFSIGATMNLCISCRSV